MRRSTERILVSHAGTLPRPAEIMALMGKGAAGEAELAQKLPAAVAESVKKQVEAGVDIVNDGEIPKRGTFSSYIQKHIQGIEPRNFGVGEATPPREVNGRDRKDFPGFFAPEKGGSGHARGTLRGASAQRPTEAERT